MISIQTTYFLVMPFLLMNFLKLSSQVYLPLLASILNSLNSILSTVKNAVEYTPLEYSGGSSSSNPTPTLTSTLKHGIFGY